MTELVTSCPLCGATSRTLFDERQFRSQLVSNSICQSCGLVYQSPRMTVDESRAFYEAEYRLLYQGQEGPDPKDLAVQAARAQVTLEFVRNHITSCSRLLDIGCSSGALLRKFQEHYQAQIVGIEPGTTYRQYSQSLGLDVYSSLAEIEPLSSPPFDLVSMLHVLEHLPNPVEYLQSLREQHLTQGGWLLLEVPNLYAHDCFEVAHQVSFSSHTITQVVKKAGYRVVQLRAHGRPRSQLIPLYLTLLAQPDEKVPYVLEPDRLVHTKRQVGLLYRRVVTRLFPNQAWISPG